VIILFFSIFYSGNTSFSPYTGHSKVRPRQLQDFFIRIVLFTSSKTEKTIEKEAIATIQQIEVKKKEG
jgi:hypothetical protein